MRVSVDKPVLTYSIHLSRKANLGNYESADVHEGISFITAETTQEEIDALLAGPGALAFKACAKALAVKFAKIKGKA